MLQSFHCPVLCEPMETPVCLADGHIYDKNGIEGWFARGNATSPLTNAPLPHLGMLPLPAFQSAIKEFRAWKDAADEAMEKSELEKVLLRCRNDTLEQGRATLAEKERRLAEEQYMLWSPSDSKHHGLKSALIAANEQFEESEVAFFWSTSPRCFNSYSILNRCPNRRIYRFKIWF